MSGAILSTLNLTKQLGTSELLSNVNMTISRGDIYGFIGNNGAGKTTFMRTITGLMKHDSGEIKLFGEKFSNNRELLKKVGALIESPVFFPEMTGYDNLKYFSILNGKSKEDVDELIQIMNLKKVAGKKVKNYSLGMKQRLGIAITLISDPEFIVLDEPLNGLDPQGIQDIRKLILKLKEERNITFLISSHILSELEQIATKYGIMHDGKLLEEFSIEDYENLGFIGFTIETDQSFETLAFLKERFPENQITIENKGEIYIGLGEDDEGILQDVLQKKFISSFYIKKRVKDMEEYFLERVENVQ
ncbi:ATP-binding cassette domain-containing protein [Enterococcus durans]|uniref:ATP-binding cassette domain-containing protein n=1 Tax=Enterococcus durans TaxID=53345 RepID=UPI00288C6C53|nr:ATP-binding cassette domain-containing protein [Enterococcus durans]MDT2836021.1 ATP-binding cassette domain-containing protein [Enterococcus durans]